MNDLTLLLRHIKRPWGYHSQGVDRKIFLPRPQDDGLLSVYDGDMITPSKSATQQKDDFDSPSLFVVGVTCQEVALADSRLKVIPAPLEKSPEHVHIDFNEIADKRERKRAGELMAHKATIRGILWSSELK